MVTEAVENPHLTQPRRTVSQLDEEIQQHEARLVDLRRIAAAERAMSEVGDPQRAVGTEWWFLPVGAGYGSVWRPGIVRIVGIHDEPIPAAKIGTPRRQYVVRMDGGTQCFANDACLFPINETRTGPREEKAVA